MPASRPQPGSPTVLLPAMLSALQGRCSAPRERRRTGPRPGTPISDRFVLPFGRPFALRFDEIQVTLFLRRKRPLAAIPAPILLCLARLPVRALVQGNEFWHQAIGG